MAKVLVTYGIHPHEKSKAIFPLRRKYKGNDKIKFVRFPHKKIVRYQIAQQLRTNPSVESRKGFILNKVFPRNLIQEER